MCPSGIRHFWLRRESPGTAICKFAFRVLCVVLFSYFLLHYLPVLLLLFFLGRHTFSFKYFASLDITWPFIWRPSSVILSHSMKIVFLYVLFAIEWCWKQVILATKQSTGGWFLFFLINTWNFNLTKSIWAWKTGQWSLFLLQPIKKPAVMTMLLKRHELSRMALAVSLQSWQE